MSVQRLSSRGRSALEFSSAIAFVVGLFIVLTASSTLAGNKLFVGGLSWDSSDVDTAMKIRPLNDRVIVHRTAASGGATSAEAYVETARGIGTLTSLPNPFGSTASGASAVDCEESSGICVASGSVENTVGAPQPILWECNTSACAAWATTLLPLPSGHTSGEALGVFVPQPSGLADAVAVGWTSDSSGVAKAATWTPNATGGFDVALLPELGSAPTPAKASRGFGFVTFEDGEFLATGVATHDSGETKPVVWYPQALPLVLPLPVGSSEGAALALTVADGAPGSQLMTIAGVAEIDDAGTPGTRALRFQCATSVSPASDCGTVGSWSMTRLEPLPGHGSSSVLDVAVLPNGYAMLAGTSYPSGSDPNATGEATLWIVESSTHSVVGKLRVSDLAHDLAPGDVPRVLTSFRASPGDGLGVHAVSGTQLGGSPRRWLMTEVPWNRRVDKIELVPAPGSTFDVEVSWRIDLAGSVSGDTELGAEVGLQINGVPETSAEAEECLIWDLDAGGAYACESLPDGASCGTAILNTVPIPLTCDADTGTCGVVVTTLFSANLPLIKNDSVVASLTPLRSAEAETVEDDDSLELIVAAELPSLGIGGLMRLGLLILVSGCLAARSRSPGLGAVG